MSRRAARLRAYQRYYERTKDRRARLCAGCRGKGCTQWCSTCRSRLCVRRNEPAPDYVARANRVITRRVGRSWREFTPDDQHEVTLLLVRWAKERGQLLDYDPNRKPLDVRDWKRPA